MLNIRGKPYYHRMRAALEEFVGNNQKEKNMCKSIYRLFFIFTTILIMIFLFTDFVYLLINVLAKSNFNTIQDLKDYDARACYYYGDEFLQNMFQRESDILYEVGQTQLDCLMLLKGQDVDVVIINEFALLKLLQQNKQFLNKLRYQVNLNTNIAHHILINNNQPDWFQSQLQRAIDFIQKQKLDLLVKEKYLPTQLQNSKSTSLMPNQPTFQLICAILSLVFILILQITLVHRQFLKYKNRNKWKGEKIK
ncbi:hypothetical protein FGO68_gene11584 [Halteria grandinella]|uniref:Uncharacterized protein n=1 Tax=Halteria grandinella TaxID=5974 RepID=A0A8J8NE10_HALGN|nr:hypothetical protein FGO68_gene11584 [Halteria grandinella]